MNWRTLHLLVGAVGFIVFVLQGQYMGNVLLVVEMADGERMMYRTAHIYLMLACAVNIVRGYGMQAVPESGALQTLVNLMFLVPVPMLLLSFFVESLDPSLDREITRFALFSLFGGGAWLLVIELYRRLRG